MLRIPAPTLGFLDLSQARDAALAASDRAMLEPLFDTVVQGSQNAPACDVLFIYCALSEDGTIAGCDVRLAAVVAKSGAIIAVVASENSATAYEAAFKDRYGRSVISQNLVLTLNRHGDGFGRFFHQLFSLMRDGKSMPAAWVKIAPQQPGQAQPENPDTIFVAAAGQVGFETRKRVSLISRLIGK